MNLFYKLIKHLVVIFSIGLIVYVVLHALHVLNPIEKLWADFKFSDIYFGSVQEQEIDDEIYFVDVGLKTPHITRKEIFEFINYVNKEYKPKIIGIDVDFPIDKTISNEINNSLIKSLQQDNIVLCYHLEKINNKWLKNKSELLIDYSQVSHGYTNNLREKNEVDFGVERFFKPAVIEDDDTLKHFSIVIAEKMNMKVASSILQANNKVMINFQYKYHNPISLGDVKNYYKLKDKIVIVGLFTKNKEGYPLYNDDVHYTPSNKYYLGKSPPNMYGGEVLASIISNLNHNTFIKYYKYLSKLLNIILTIVLYFALLYFLGKSHKLFTAVTILQQFFLVAFIVFLSIFFIMTYGIYIDLTPLAIFAFFSVEFVGVIDEIIYLLEPKIKHFFYKHINKSQK